MTKQKKSNKKADKIEKIGKSYRDLIKYNNCQITDKKSSAKSYLLLNTLRRVLTKSIFCFGIFCQIVYILTEFRMSSSSDWLIFFKSFQTFIFVLYSNSSLNNISNALETVFTATRAVSDVYANKGGFKIVFAITVQDVKLTLLTKSSGEQCAVNEQWPFEYDDGR
ncbi:hypothetical protein T4A_239 [Trichinella pseudospiralis]|uniref:Uncharacterized protein n=2 Tax=Trichinella pseudospiralis TaxID=6337 RepID=A0A0V1EEH6_TRIPS|nr:hypothetical protein T4A_239 [Trichinella pseudospiralis]